MKLFSLNQDVINEFITDNTLYKSENIGVLYLLNDEEKQIVKEFEKEHNAVVYHIIKSYTEFGTLLNMFYVSQYIEEREYDIGNIPENRQLCYVKNLSDECCSEFGYICFRKSIGGLIGTA
jgi:hypothetical protein